MIKFLLTAECLSFFKYLGIYFDDDLKRELISDNVYGKLQQRFHDFFCFKLIAAPKHYFIRSTIQPVFTYNFELSCNSATKKQINRMTGKRKKKGILTLILIPIYTP